MKVVILKEKGRPYKMSRFNCYQKWTCFFLLSQNLPTAVNRFSADDNIAIPTQVHHKRDQGMRCVDLFEMFDNRHSELEL